MCAMRGQSAVHGGLKHMRVGESFRHLCVKACSRDGGNAPLLDLIPLPQKFVRFRSDSLTTLYLAVATTARGPAEEVRP